MSQQQPEKAPLSVHGRSSCISARTATWRAGESTGRVEHVVSGQSAHFDSLEHLLAFLDRVLTTVRAPPRRSGRNSPLLV